MRPRVHTMVHGLLSEGERQNLVLSVRFSNQHVRHMCILPVLMTDVLVSCLSHFSLIYNSSCGLVKVVLICLL